MPHRKKWEGNPREKKKGHKIPSNLSVVEQEFLQSLASLEELHSGWLSPETWAQFTGHPKRDPYQEKVD